MNPHPLMETKTRRRYFYLGSTLALVALISIRFFVLPRLGGGALPPFIVVVGSILDILFATLVASVAVTLLLAWLTPPMMVKAAMEIVTANQIREKLNEALYETNEWWYRGHSGRHFRAVTIEKLAEQATASGLSKKTFLLILDPNQESTCEYYAEYRRGLSPTSGDEPWTNERVRKELLATIISAYAWKHEVPFLDITIGLIDKVSLFRVDLSSRLVLITKEHRQEPALSCGEGTFFYNQFREDLRMSLRQARLLSDKVKGVPFNQMSTDNVGSLLQALGLKAHWLSQDGIDEIINLARTPKNPYA